MLINLNRAVVRIAGDDAANYLQSMTSNNIKKITSNSAQFNYLLTPQGKYLFDFFVYKESESSFLIDIANTLKDDFIKRINMYKLRSKVTINELENMLVAISLEGDISFDSSILASYSDSRAVDKNIIRYIINNNSNLDITEDKTAYLEWRIDNIIPEGLEDFSPNEAFPLHYLMRELNAVDFNKGCYVGQEVTARMHHRDKVNKSVYKAMFEQNIEGIDKFSEILDDKSKKCGCVLSTFANKALILLDVNAATEPPHNLELEGNKLISIAAKNAFTKSFDK